MAGFDLSIYGRFWGVHRGFPTTPPDFSRRLDNLLAQPGRSPAELSAAVEALAMLFRETVALSEGLYRPQAVL